MNLNSAGMRLRAADPGRDAPALLTNAQTVIEHAATAPMIDQDPTRVARSHRSWRRVLVAAAIIAVAGAAAATQENLVGEPAYAITPRPDGSVQLKFDEGRFFDADQASDLQADLNHAGLHAAVLVASPAGQCEEPEVDNVAVSGFIADSDVNADGTRTIVFQPSTLPSGSTLLVVMAPDDLAPEDKTTSISVRWRVPSCVTYN